MEFAGHKKIKKFTIDGQIYDEAEVLKVRTQYDQIMDNYLREKGYVPHLDLDPLFSMSYNGNTFEFKITWYGVYLGKAKAKCYKGISGTNLIPMKSMSRNKLEKSSFPVE